MMYGNHMGTGGWIFSIFGTLIVIALVIATILWLASSRREGSQASAESAGAILDRRLASGEITSSQYDELRQTLTAGTSSRQRPASAAGTPG
jgi:uncharacterized membrane protein